ncbi:hypothetical protein RB10973 [Rhodopirellula baltica SH 1]|uniref:Uncharacterized protein n=1 Tax=Rhodopirellula baltica (strain DSM 10527 / NCIMB 13988 / SH1) TaxID=243090 RepID=Q7UJY7_RHOBA|nr:hypothetical protein RB10973 [Rhodopirellula baltica SH 1]
MIFRLPHDWVIALLMPRENSVLRDGSRGRWCSNPFLA